MVNVINCVLAWNLFEWKLFIKCFVFGDIILLGMFSNHFKFQNMQVYCYKFLYIFMQVSLLHIVLYIFSLFVLILNSYKFVGELYFIFWMWCDIHCKFLSFNLCVWTTIVVNIDTITHNIIANKSIPTTKGKQ